MIMFSYFWFEFMIHYSSLTNYEISSSSNVYIETILKFNSYQWDPHGITNNPNVKKEDVLSNPQLPWIYTEFMQDWVDEEWINRFPNYTEKIIPKINFVPNFVKQKILKNIPISYTNSVIEEYFPEARIENKNSSHENKIDDNCLFLQNITDRDFNYDIQKRRINKFCIHGNTNLDFDIVRRYYDRVKFIFSNDVFFITEYNKIVFKLNV